jgi:hypothetical protein
MTSRASGSPVCLPETGLPSSSPSPVHFFRMEQRGPDRHKWTGGKRVHIPRSGPSTEHTEWWLDLDDYQEIMELRELLESCVDHRRLCR